MDRIKHICKELNALGQKEMSKKLNAIFNSEETGNIEKIKGEFEDFSSIEKDSHIKKYTDIIMRELNSLEQIVKKHVKDNKEKRQKFKSLIEDIRDTVISFRESYTD